MGVESSVSVVGFQISFPNQATPNQAVLYAAVKDVLIVLDVVLARLNLSFPA
jgi:hypothetical protein